MACRGVHFAITDSDAIRLLDACGDEAIVRIVQEEIEERWEEAWLHESDKAWDAIDRCLIGGTAEPDGGSDPLRLAILGGRQLHTGAGYVVSLVTPDEVKELAVALSRIDNAWFRERYSTIDPDDYGGSTSDEDFEYTWEYFLGLVPFFQNAAAAGRYVIFTVDQ